MKNKYIIFSIFFIVCGLFFSCENGMTINENSFRSVASFLLPAVDEPTGLALFTPEFKFATQGGQYEQIDNETAFLRLTELTGTEMILNAQLTLNGLVNNQYGNVKVTTVWTPIDASSATLVKEVHFDKYNMMVFAANTGITSYNPSSAEVQIKLDTSSPNKMGILSFKFEYAQSIYDSTKCLKEYQLFISTGTDNKPFAVFSRIRATDAPEEPFSFGGSKAAYTAAYTDFTPMNVSQSVTKNLAVDLLYIDSAHPLTLRLENENSAFSISNVSPMTVSDGKGTITFNLTFNPGNLSPAGVSGSANLIIEDPSGYYVNLPLSIPIKTNRAVYDFLKNSFAENGDATPWRWRTVYRIQTADLGPFGKKYKMYNDNGYNGGQNSPNDFVAGYKKLLLTATEKITTTQKSVSVGEKTAAMAVFLDSSKENTNLESVNYGDTVNYAAWLYSNPIALYEGYEYKFKISVYIGEPGTVTGSNAKRTSLYMASVTDDNNSLTLDSDTGPALAVTGSTTANGSLITHPLPETVGWHDLEYTIVPTAQTSVRFIVEKGAPNWSSIGLSEVRSGEVAVSNVSLGYK